MGISKPRPLVRDDDRAVFDCGRESLNKWFRQYAWRNQASGASRTNVVCDTETGDIVGYVSLTSTKIQRSFLVKKHQRNMPDPVPAILLGQLAVDIHYHGKGIASSLMLFVFRTVLEVSNHIGCSVLLTHPLDDDVRAFYQQFGFVDMPFDPDRAMCMRIADLRKSMEMKQ